jgi:hypothetical protein
MLAALAASFLIELGLGLFFLSLADGYRFCNPGADFLFVLHNFAWKFPVTHFVGLTSFSGVGEGVAAGGLVILGIAVIHLKPELIVGNNGKNQAVLVDAVAAKHGPEGDAGEMAQNIGGHILGKWVLDWGHDISILPCLWRIFRLTGRNVQGYSESRLGEVSITGA